MAIRRYNRGKISRPQDDEEYEEYTIKRGDSLSSITKSFTGDAKNYREIARRNGISDVNRIYEGDTIYIPKSMIKGQSSISRGETGIMPMSANTDLQKSIVPPHRDMEPLYASQTEETTNRNADKTDIVDTNANSASTSQTNRSTNNRRSSSTSSVSKPNTSLKASTNKKTHLQTVKFTI